MSDIAKMATKQKIIEVKLKVNETKSDCRTQKQQPKIQDMKLDVQRK